MEMVLWAKRPEREAIYMVNSIAEVTNEHSSTNITLRLGTRGTAVVKALCYKPEGCVFETR
jgi:hypothetical protein